MTTQFDWPNHSSVQLIKSNASDIDVARAAWVSFDFESDKREAEEGRVNGLINFLMREHHTSPFEHGSFTFKIDTPIFVAREFMRHRTWSFNEVSGRYTEMKPSFYIPGIHRPLVQNGKAGDYKFIMGEDGQSEYVNDVMWGVCVEAWDTYQEMLKDGIAKEVARMILPLNLMTSFYATANPLNVMRFLNLRMSEQALYEIREVANEISAYLQREMPMTYDAYKEHGLS